MDTVNAPMPMQRATAETLLSGMEELSSKALGALERKDLDGLLDALLERDSAIAELDPLLDLLIAHELQVEAPGAVGAVLTRASRRLQDADALLQLALEKQRDSVSAEISELKAKSGRERHFLSKAGSSHTLNTRG